MNTDLTKKETNISPKKYVLKKTETIKKYSIDYKAELNEKQYEAVIHDKGAALIIAGAGSGKTRTLVYRVARLVESGVNPKNILLLTFTRKAANQMLDRASVILDSRCEDIQGGTFHSFANTILRQYSAKLDLKNNFTILDRADSEDVVNLIRGELINTKAGRFPRKGTVFSIYSKAVNKNQSIASIIENEYPHFEKNTEKVIEICQRYVTYKKENSLLDYDDLLLYLKTLLSANEDIRKKLSTQYKYIMIDEYQDTNCIQADIITLLACEHNNVVAVGDDSQSIYSFRGANFKNIINFPKIFENAKIIKLEENYRSTQEILDLTNNIIKEAKEKYSKELFTNIKNGEIPALITAPTQMAEAEFITQRVLELHEENIKLDDIAVLARSARSTYQLEIELNKKGIPFKKYGGFKFIETAHIKDMISYLRVIVNNEDKVSWNRILLLISGVGNQTCAKLLPVLSTESTELSFGLLPLNGKSKSKLEELVKVIMSIRKGHFKPTEAVEILQEYYHPILSDKYDDFNKREKDIEHFSYLAENYDKLENFLSDLVLEPPDTSFDDIDEVDKPDEFLTISTIHSSKGLEWDTVFVMGAVEGKFPSLFAYGNDDDMEEERRLMYVASTRAKNKLYISYPIDLFDYSSGMVLSKPSRFVEKVPREILEHWCLVEE